MTKHQRAVNVNRIIMEIASCDECFFRNSDRVAEMVVKNNRVYFLDERSGKLMQAKNYKGEQPRGFSGGCETWGLVMDFAHYINTGERSNGKHGYGGLYSNQWGYTETCMEYIRDLAIDVGYLTPKKSNYGSAA